MVYEPELLDRLEAIAFAHFEGTVWRHMFGGGDPAKANTRGARWNPPGVSAIYTSIDRATALAEAQFALDVQPVPPQTSRELYRVEVKLDRLLDLSDRALLLELGINDEGLASNDQTACRNIGGASAWLGCDGILVPSARAAGPNLVLYVDRMDPDAPFTVIEQEDPS